MSDDAEAVENKKNAAHQMLNKLRRFMDEELLPAERQALAALLAPGIASVYKDENDEDEVSGFHATNWLPDQLPNYLSSALQTRRWHLEGE